MPPREDFVRRICTFSTYMLCRLILVVAVVLLAARPARAQEAAIAGRVLDAATGTPIPGVNVVALRNGEVQRGAGTGADGHFRMEGLAPGAYDVRVTAVGFRSRTLSRPGRHTEVTMAAGLPGAPRSCTSGAAVPSATPPRWAWLLAATSLCLPAPILRIASRATSAA